MGSKTYKTNERLLLSSFCFDHFLSLALKKFSPHNLKKVHPVAIIRINKNYVTLNRVEKTQLAVLISTVCANNASEQQSSLSESLKKFKCNNCKNIPIHKFNNINFKFL